MQCRGCKNQKCLCGWCLGSSTPSRPDNFIWDAAFRTLAPEQVYDETESPLSYPKSMRTECIVINSIGLPSGKEETIFVPYKGGEGEPVEFLDSFPEGAESKSRFPAIALEGWNQANKQEEFNG